MPDRTLEQRMTEIEEGFANMQQEWLNIPDVIEARLRLTDFERHGRREALSG